MISLSLMVLMTVLVVGMLSLSTVALRSGVNGQARAEAEANARMALAVALGELQSKLGPDQRISARSSMMGGSAAEPNVVGAWRSWRWEPGSGYAEKEQRFLGWLASSRDEARSRDEDWPKTSFGDAVTLLSSRGDANGGQDLRAEMVDVNEQGRSGGYAWAVMDESQKAPIHLEEQQAKTNGETLARRVAPMTANPQMALAELSDEKLKSPSKLVSIESATLATGLGSESQVIRQQQNLTSYSMGLLTNVLDGGLRTDLTTVFEEETSPQEFLKEISLYGDKTSQTPGVPTWAYLKSHYDFYKKVTSAAGSAPVYQIRSTSKELETDRRSVAQADKGIYAVPESERLLPVIAKFQIMFSIVTHHAHISDRVNYFNQYGSPQGNTNYGVPHLVYDPVVTLYNPYDVALDIQRLRMRISDPPVLFGFKKNNDWLRDEFGATNGGGFQPLTRFQIAHERLTNPPPRYFTLVFGGGNADNYSGRIRLEPGEVKVFSPRVETSWNWGNETAGGYTPRAFFDWDAGRNLGNNDGRTGNAMGVETVAGWDPRAGLQTDHLSYSTRPPATRYDFEKASPGMDGGWLGIKMDDTFSAYAKAGPPNTSGGDGDFSVTMLAASDADHTRDILRTYRFKFADVAKEISANPSNPVIAREFQVRNILQAANDGGPGGKSPFALLSMTAKTTKAPMDNAMPWLHNHPVVEGSVQDTTKVDNALNSYDVRFEEVSDFTSSDGIEFDPVTKRGYFGASSSAQDGVSNVPMFRVPVTPIASLGELIPANLVASAQLPRVTHAFGNSRAHPLLPTDAVTRSGGELGTLYDHSYLLNEALWDRYYFSTVAEYRGGLMPVLSRQNVLKQFLRGEGALLNPRFVPLLDSIGDPDQGADELLGLKPEERSRRMATVMGVRGPFNVNSDSVEAWKAVLGSLRGKQVLGWGGADFTSQDRTAFPRMGFPIAGASDDAPAAGVDVMGAKRWAGYRALTDDEIDRLAKAIVEEIRARGEKDRAPFLSLAEFVNRRVGTTGDLHVLEGLLQAAIRKSGINDAMHEEDSKDLAGGTGSMKGLASAEARTGKSAEGAPSMLTQGDLMMGLAPVVTVRGDTFRIRAYGESRDKDHKVQARAWCEAVVQRMPEYVDPADGAEVPAAQLSRPANRSFGRRFVVTSFRWISPEEV